MLVKVIIFILVGIIIAIVIFLKYRLVLFRRASAKHSRMLYEPLEPLLPSLESGRPDDTLIKKYAEDIKTRSTLFIILSENNLLEYFPKNISIEDIGESFLASWLSHPYELDAWPDEIKFIEKVTGKINGKDIYYLAYKYKTNEPHWAFRYGWMLGTVGPFYASDLYPKFYLAFSNVAPMGGKSPKEIIGI